MLHITSGTNTAARKKHHAKVMGKNAWVQVESGKDPLGMIFRLLNSGGGLFGDASTSIVVTAAAELDTFTDFLTTHFDALTQSPYTFIFDDLAFLTEQEKVFKKLKIVPDVFDLQKPAELNVFALTDALATGSKKIAWSAYRKALDSGIAADAMTGPVWWWLKGLGLTHKGVRTAKPFVQKKLDTAAKLFGDAVPELLVSFCEAVNNARTVSKIEAELEAWILKGMVKN